MRTWARNKLQSSETWALVASAVAMLLLFSLWQGEDAGWPGTPNGCREFMRPNCFCERLHDGAVAQPSNTWSNLGFVVAGIAVGRHADRVRRRGRRRRALLFSSALYPTVFAVAIGLLGPGSMALHATMTIWGGRIDVTSMYVFIGLAVAWACTRLFELSGLAFAGLYAAILAALTASKFVLPINSDFVFGGMIALAIGLNILLVSRRRDLTWKRGYVFAAAGLFATAFAVWLPSRTGGPLCAPDSLLQGHAVWHLLCAASALCVYFYAASEEASEES